MLFDALTFVSRRFPERRIFQPSRVPLLLVCLPVLRHRPGLNREFVTAYVVLVHETREVDRIISKIRRSHVEDESRGPDSGMMLSEDMHM
jgi:hypothetical protein